MGNTASGRRKHMKITTQQEALTQALFLAVTAPDEKLTQEVTELAESIAQGMPAVEVERATAAANALIDMQMGDV